MFRSKIFLVVVLLVPAILAGQNFWQIEHAL